MIYNILYYYNRIADINTLISNQVYTIIDYYKSQNKFPAQSDSYEEAVKIEESDETVDYKVSAFWGYYLLLIEKLNLRDLYEIIKGFFHLKSIRLKVWK